MKRDLRALSDRGWEVLVIGGGIHGACVAWDAVLRGLTVCLVEKSDFASATSANTMKIVHGGLRYLQRADYRRMRDSLAEQRTLLRIAPHLVHPLPVVVPTYGYGWRSRPVLRVALALNDLVGLGRQTRLDGEPGMPRSRTVSRRECLSLAPELDAADLTGAGLFYDAQVYNSERLVLAFLRSAAKAGAEVANYAEVTGLQRERGGPVRATVVDRLTGDVIVVHAHTVVNASGPWVDHVGGLARPATGAGTAFAKAFNVVTHRLFSGHAVALRVRPASGTAGGRGGRSLFVVPWRGRSLVGTWYERHEGAPGDVRVTEEDVARLLGEVNRACPALAVTLDDVRLVHGGLLPVSSTDRELPERQLARHGRIVDHARDGFPGLLSVVGVKYTTARLMAERAVDRVFERLGRKPPRSVSARVPLHGGDTARVTTEVESAPSPTRTALPPPLASYGSACGDVLAHLDPGEHAGNPVAVLRAEVRHAIRIEMAHTLADVVFRRTELASAGDPGPHLLGVAARAAGLELGWSKDRECLELGQVYGRFGVPR